MKERQEIINYFERGNGVTPYHRFQKGAKGPKVLFVGGTHGNEICGIHAIDYWCKFFENGPENIIKGEVHFLLANPKAYLADQRFVDKDLNRSFEDSENDNYEAERAKEISALFEREKFDYVIDLHSVKHGHLKLAIYHHRDKKMQNLAFKACDFIDKHFLYREDIMSNSLIEQARVTEAHILAIECGNHWKKESIDFAHTLIPAVLNEVGNTSLENFKATPSREQKTLYHLVDMVRPAKGFRYIEKIEGAEMQVKAHTPFARDDFGDRVYERDGVILMGHQDYRPGIMDMGFFCTKQLI